MPMQIAKKHDQTIDNFIIVANIVANLGVIIAEAKKLSLTAKNARVVALRAGDAALGFKPITNFIDEFSTETIRCSMQIEAQSRSLFRMALAVMRSQDYLVRLAEARRLDGGNKLKERLLGSRLEFTERDTELANALYLLQGYFEDIQKQMRSAEYIAVTSRVEASKAQEYCHSLESVSDYISRAALKIKQATAFNLNEINKIQRNVS